MVDISEDILAKAKDKLRAITKDWDSGVCCGATLDLNGRTWITGHTACHSWLTSTFRDKCKVGSTWDFSYTSYHKDAEDFLLLTSHKKEMSSATPEATDAIILWLARESPFAKYVLNADDTNSLTNDGAIILCGPNGASLAEAMWMCKVLRYSTEGSRALDTWKVLYDGGVNPLLAVLVCTHMSSVKGATFGAATVTGHVTVFNYDWAVDPDIGNVLKAKINPKAKDTSSLFGVRSKKETLVAETVKKKFCAPFKKSDGWGGMIEGKGADGPELVKRVLQWQHGLEKKHGLAESSPAPLPDSNTVYLDLDL